MKKATLAQAGSTMLACVLLAGCHSAPKTVDEAAAAPPKTTVVSEPDLNVVKIDRPERFALVSAEKQD